MAQQQSTAVSAVVGSNDGFKKLMEAYGDSLKSRVPTYCNAERMLALFRSAFSNNPDLQICTKLSLISSLAKAAETGLEVNGPLGEAYLIARNDKSVPRGTKLCSFQIGYKGWMKLARNTGGIKMFNAQVVYKEDHFDFSYAPYWIKHKPYIDGEVTTVRGAYAQAFLTNGADPFFYWHLAQLHKHRDKFSEQWKHSKGGIWANHPEEAYKKTVIIKLIGSLDRSIELQKLQAQAAYETALDRRPVVDALGLPVGTPLALTDAGGGQELPEDSPGELVDEVMMQNIKTAAECLWPDESEEKLKAVLREKFDTDSVDALTVSQGNFLANWLESEMERE